MFLNFANLLLSYIDIDIGRLTEIKWLFRQENVQDAQKKKQ